MQPSVRDEPQPSDCPDATLSDAARAGCRRTGRRGGVGALMTTRPAASARALRSLNLGARSATTPERSPRNRALFAEAIGATPVFLSQVHGTRVVRLAWPMPSGRRRSRRPTRPSPPSPASPAPCWSPTACRCCLPRPRGAPWRRRMPAGAAWPPACSKRRSRTVRGRGVRAAATWWPGSGPASGPPLRSRRRRARGLRRRRCGHASARAAASRADGRRQVAGRPCRPGARPPARGRRGAGQRRQLVHRRGPRHGSFRSGATASPAAWPPPSGSGARAEASAAARRAARRRAGVPSRYSTIDSGSTPYSTNVKRAPQHAAVAASASATAIISDHIEPGDRDVSTWLCRTYDR